MFAAMALSLLFTFTYATWAAKSPRAEVILIPLLDILQSVPILGFISVTVVYFMSLAPGLVLGAEFAAIFAIFTSQAWNMAFSFYQSLRTIPEELLEASRNFRFGAWMRFWRLDVPFAMPALVWNMMMSMSGGWFFVVASEAITVGDTTVTLPGIGSYIATAIAHRDLAAVGWAIGAMLVVILIYDQLLFRPLVAWADRFRFEQETGAQPPRSWVLTILRRSRLAAWLTAPLGAAWRWSYRAFPMSSDPRAVAASHYERSDWMHWLWYLLVAFLALIALHQIAQFVMEGVLHRRGWKSRCARARDDGARFYSHRHRKRHLGSDRRLGWLAARSRAIRAADRSIHGGVPGQSFVSNRGLRHCRFRA